MRLWILGNDPKLSKRVLTLRPEHITGILELPPIHRDPFDRLLFAQARTEGMILATSNRQIRQIRQYEVSTIW